MNVRTQRLGAAHYLSPDFPIVDENLATLQMAVDEAQAQGATDLVIDLEAVTVLDSRGLELLVDLATTLRERGGSLRLAAASPLCRQIFAVSRVDQTLAVYDDLESVGRSFL